jgi:hypothetical protein
MSKVAIICNYTDHVRTVLGLNPHNPDLLIITPERTNKMYGTKDVCYYPLRPLYAREQAYAELHGWKPINKTELKELLS